MEKGMTLLYLSSRYIESYIKAHPVTWADRELAKHGGAGDQAGRAPYPFVQMWLECLHEIGDLFTQEQYVTYVRQRCSEWWSKLTPLQQRGVSAKLYNNYFPSMIDSLHAWALLSESGWFDMAVVDSYQDAVAKSDITVRYAMTETHIALFGPGKTALDMRKYKVQKREGYNVETVPVQMTWDRPVIGGKRWYRLSDFEHIKPEVVMKRCI